MEDLINENVDTFIKLGIMTFLDNTLKAEIEGLERKVKKSKNDVETLAYEMASLEAQKRVLENMELQHELVMELIGKMKK